MMSKKIALLLFARTPQLGAVKTRLAADIGASAALSLHIAFIHDSLALLLKFPQAKPAIYLTSPWPQTLTPLPTAITEQRVAIRYQSDGDLGARMQQAMRENFADQCYGVIIIGSDSPNLPADYLQTAIAVLANNDCVIGPSVDGGYYLIGARYEIAAQLENLFENINWSTETVFRDTVARINKAGWRAHYLPQWYDIDTIDDLKRLKQVLNDETLQTYPLLQNLKEF